jgi:hypothetical protein
MPQSVNEFPAWKLTFSIRVDHASGETAASGDRGIQRIDGKAGFHPV